MNKILFVNPFWKPYEGGVERVIQKLTTQFTSQNGNNKVALLTSFNLYPFGKVQTASKDSNDMLTVYRLNFFPSNIPFITNIRNSGFISLEVKKVIHDFCPDIIQFMTDGWYFPNLLVYLASQKKSRHYYSPFYHDIQKNVANNIMIGVNRYLMNRVDAIQVYSEVEKNKIIKIYKAPQNKIHILKLGVDEPINNGIKSTDEIILLSVGRLGHSKGQFELVKIFKVVLKKVTKKVKLILVGSDGGDLDKINQYILNNNLEKNILIAGKINDEELNRLYSKSDIFVHATRYESFGLVLFDALAHKLPIVTYSVGALPEILQKGTILIEPFNTGKFANAIVDLIDSEDLRHKLSNAGYKYVHLNYSWKNTARDYLNIYRTPQL